MSLIYNSILKMFGIHILRLTCRSKICRTHNLYISGNLKSIQIERHVIRKYEDKIFRNI